MPMRRGLLLAGLAWCVGAQAQEPVVWVEGQPFARSARVAGSDLILNGTGVRAVAWFKGYVAGLYLPTAASTEQQALAPVGPKRLQLRMLQEVPAAEFVKALKRGIERNSTAAEMTELAPRLQGFSEQIMTSGPVRKGEVVDLDLDPTRGMLFSRNGTLRGPVVPGADFYGAMLRAFIGEHPYDKRLKAGLLGQPLPP
jgi:hypothetical protein